MALNAAARGANLAGRGEGGSRPRVRRRGDRKGIMAILLDSASIDDALAAAAMGFVTGITTNPALMARETGAPLEHLQRLLDAFPHGPVCYQPTLSDAATMDAQARAATALDPERVIAKLPATLEAARLACALRDEGRRSAFTAVYSPAQALLAHESGCAWIIPYVDRAARHSAGAVVREQAEVLERLDSATRILAASVKSPQQAVQAVLDGAHDLTVPLEVLRALPEHPLTESAVREFAAAWQ
jgi:transaldolase